MKASEIANQANNLTDENHDFQTLLGFINAGLAEINIELNANFPFASSNDEEISFPVVWQHAVLVPYVGAKIKQKDSSQFEYMDLYGQFQKGLLNMKSKYTVPDAYKSTEIVESFAPDFTGNYYSWNGGSNGGGPLDG